MNSSEKVENNNQICQITERSFDNLFLICFGLYLISEVLRETAWFWLNMEILDLPLKLLRFFAVFASIVLICLKNKYTVKAMYFAVVSFIILGISFYYTRDASLLYFLIFLIASYNVDKEKIVRLSAIVHGAILAIVIFASYTGLAVNGVFIYEERIRYALGFSYANKASTLFLFLTLEIVYLMRKKMKWYVLVLLGAISVLLFKATDARMAFLLTIATILICLLFICFKRSLWLKKHYYLLAAPVVICFVTLILYLIFQNQGFLGKINAMMSGRLKLGQNAIGLYGITLFGQQINWVGHSIVENDIYNYVDCAYIRTLVSDGVFVLIWELILYSFTFLTAIRRRSKILAFILLIVSLLCVMEPRLISLSYNVFPLFAITLFERQRTDGLSEIG